MGEHRLQILRRPAVSKTKYPIWLAAAPARVPRHRVPSAFRQRVDHAEHVVPGGIPLQAVGQHRQPPRTSPDPIQVEEIVVERIDAFALIGHRADSAQQMGKQSLEVAIGKEPGRLVGRRRNDGHGES